EVEAMNYDITLNNAQAGHDACAIKSQQGRCLEATEVKPAKPEEKGDGALRNTSASPNGSWIDMEKRINDLGYAYGFHSFMSSGSVYLRRFNGDSYELIRIELGKWPGSVLIQHQVWDDGQVVKDELVFDHEDASNLIAILGGLIENLERARPRDKD